MLFCGVPASFVVAKEVTTVTTVETAEAVTTAVAMETMTNTSEEVKTSEKNEEQKKISNEESTVEGSESDKKPTDENVKEESQEQLPLVNFLIMTPNGEAIALNYVSLMENISYLKQNLSEFIETCGYTNYSLEYRPEEGEALTLSDYAELNAYFGEKVGQTLTLQMIPQSYDSKTARAHVKRTRDILSYPPQLKGVSSKPKESKAEPAASEVSEEAKEASLEEMKANIERVKAALPTDGDIFSAESVSLKDYYQEVLYRVSANPDTPAHASPSPADSIRSIFFSGWNPPPPPRKLRGDLFYLEVHFAVPNAPALHITAQSHGFYINKSSTSIFDPSPAPNANFSHELLETLIASSPAISNSWNAISKRIDQELAKSLRNTEEDITTIKANSLEPVAALYAQGRGDLVAQVPEWTFRPLDGNRKNKNLNYDMSRAQDDLCDSFGIEEKGALREWNEEIQAIRQLPTKDNSEYLMKARYSQRITQEFVEACKVAIVAICNGHIVAVNPMDDVANQVYMYNNIFFSRPVDVRETFKVTQGNEACHKVAGHDLRNQKILQSLHIDGLHTVLTAIVDYKGQRWIGQSVIPGILQASENPARLMYGILEDGARMKCKTPAYNIMKEIGTKLSLVERNVPAVPAALESKSSAKPENQSALLGFLASGDSQNQIIRLDDLDEVVETDATAIPHIGPLEGKILRGSDGRYYALEMTRLTPRDANYVKSRGTGKISESDLENIDENVCVAYVLRDELIQSYKETRSIQLRQEEMVRTYEKMTEESKAEEDKKKNKEIEDKPSEPTEKAPSDEAPSDEASQSAAEKLFSPEVVNRISGICIELPINPNVFLHSPCDVDEKTIEADEFIAKDLASFLWDCVLPNITELVRLGEEAPYDGKSLTQFLHSRGVNMRYLGELSRRARAEEEIDRKTQLENQKRKNPMPVFWQDLLEVEIIARSMKHMINSFIADSGSKIPPSAIISHLLNLLMGTGEILPEVDLNELISDLKLTDKKKKNGKKSSKGSSKVTASRVSPTVPTPESFNLSKDEFWKKYSQLAKSKFLHYDSLLFVQNPSGQNGNPFTFSQRLSKLSILRRICQICGIRIQCKDYDWNLPTPFTETDIQDIVPLVKSCEPDTPLPAAKYLLDSAKLFLQQGNIITAYERSQDASKYLSEVVGPVHPEMSRALSYLYVVLLRIGDMKNALSTLAKKLTVDVQLHGLDSAETLQNHLNMSLGYQEVGNYLAAAAHIRSAVYILRLLCGDQHPEISSIYLRLSGIYNEVGNTELAFKCLKIAKELVYLNGDQGTHALICQNMAGLHAQFDQFKEAIALQKECYVILRQLFGEQDTKTADAKVRFETLIRKSAERNDQKSEREKKEKEGAAESSLWLDDNFGAKKSKKSNKGKKGKKN